MGNHCIDCEFCGVDKRSKGALLWCDKTNYRSCSEYRDKYGDAHIISDLEAQLAEARKVLERFAAVANLIDRETEGMSETDELELIFHDYLMASWPVSMFRSIRHALEGGNDD